MRKKSTIETHTQQYNSTRHMIHPSCGHAHTTSRMEAVNRNRVL